MNWNLNELQKQIISKKWLIISAVAIIILILVALLIKKIRPERLEIKTIPPQISTQPVKDGKFDAQAPQSQKSKSSFEKIRPKLPYRKTLNTSTGNEITFVVFERPGDEFTLYVETLGINFQTSYDDPNLAKNVQDFRETAADILNWLEDQNVSPADIFISWGDRAYIKKYAESWLLESPQYPKVIKSGDKFVFEKEPAK